MFDQFAGKAKKNIEETVSGYEKQQAELDKANPDRSGAAKFIESAGAGARVLGDLV